MDFLSFLGLYWGEASVLGLKAEGFGAGCV